MCFLHKPHKDFGDSIHHEMIAPLGEFPAMLAHPRCAWGSAPVRHYRQYRDQESDPYYLTPYLVAAAMNLEMFALMLA